MLIPKHVDGGDGPAYYAQGKHTWWRDVRAVLHPPYTAWHLSFVVIGSLLGARVNWEVLGTTVLAFFLAVGIAAHALDELRGRPLGTALPTQLLLAMSAAGLGGAATLGVLGALRLGPALLIFVAAGTFLVLAYNLELFNGRIHTDLGFALAWGAFPVLTAAFAQAGSLSAAALLVALSATLLSGAQRRLSNSARAMRRRHVIDGRLIFADGHEEFVTREVLLNPLEGALKYLSWSTLFLAAGMAAFRLGH